MVKIWASGTVRRVADGLTDKASSRAKKILPAGALLWAWDADPEYDELAGEKWLVLQPQKWNKHVQYAWRYDPCELLPQGSPRPPPRAPRVDPVRPLMRRNTLRSDVLRHVSKYCRALRSCLGAQSVHSRLSALVRSRWYVSRCLMRSKKFCHFSGYN